MLRKKIIRKVFLKNNIHLNFNFNIIHYKFTFKILINQLSITTSDKFSFNFLNKFYYLKSYELIAKYTKLST